MRGDSIDASRPESRVDLWMENENIFDRSERSLSAVRPLLPSRADADGRSGGTFFKAAARRTMRCPLLPLPRPARLGEIINFDAKNGRKIGFGRTRRRTREVDATEDVYLYV